jgi:hypothetical protein
MPKPHPPALVQSTEPTPRQIASHRIAILKPPPPPPSFSYNSPTHYPTLNLPQKMSSNVGLTTPRGSGTSGYVQRNTAHLKPRDAPYPSPDTLSSLNHRQRQPDAGIIEHERKRDIEVKVFELRDKLEEEGSLDEDAIDDQCDALRKKLEAEQKRNGGAAGKKGLKSHQVHEMAKAKIEESERLRRALGISKDYEEGSHWRRQEERVAGREKAVKEKTRERSSSRSESRSRSQSRSVSRSVSRSRSR